MADTAVAPTNTELLGMVTMDTVVMAMAEGDALMDGAGMVDISTVRGIMVVYIIHTLERTLVTCLMVIIPFFGMIMNITLAMGFITNTIMTSIP